jgi:uncharacterized membrane protein YkvA (DUF1232 family)
MSNKPKIIPTQNSGVFQNLLLQAKLVLRLMGDRRVNFFLKLLPIAAAIYLVSPIDILPDIALPVIGFLDDAVVIWLGTTLFVALCPDDVVQEHLNALHKVVSATWREAPQEGGTGEILDVKPRDTHGEK